MASVGYKEDEKDMMIRGRCVEEERELGVGVEVDMIKVS